ncbi:MAG: hypothetical protein AAF770_03695 [Bacteroidota bacterium]
MLTKQHSSTSKQLKNFVMMLCCLLIVMPTRPAQVDSYLDPVVGTIKSYAQATTKKSALKFKKAMETSIIALVSYLTTLDNFRSSDSQLKTIEDVVQKLSQVFKYLIQTQPNHYQYLKEGIDMIYKEFATYTLDVDNNILIAPWQAQVFQLEEAIKRRKALTQKAEKKESTSLVVAEEIKKIVDDYMQRFDHYYLVNEEEAYRQEADRQRTYYDAILSILKSGLEKLPQEEQKRVGKQLYDDWLQRKKEADKQTEWKQMNMMAKLYDVLRTYYITFIAELHEDEDKLSDCSWWITPHSFWEKTIAPLVAAKIKLLQKHLGNKTVENYLAFSSPDQQREDRLFLQNGMQVALTLNQNVTSINQLIQNFVKQVACITKRKQEEQIGSDSKQETPTQSEVVSSSAALAEEAIVATHAVPKEDFLTEEQISFAESSIQEESGRNSMTDASIVSSSSESNQSSGKEDSDHSTMQKSSQLGPSGSSQASTPTSLDHQQLLTISEESSLQDHNLSHQESTFFRQQSLISNLTSGQSSSPKITLHNSSKFLSSHVMLEKTKDTTPDHPPQESLTHHSQHEIKLVGGVETTMGEEAINHYSGMYRLYLLFGILVVVTLGWLYQAQGNKIAKKNEN